MIEGQDVQPLVVPERHLRPPPARSPDPPILPRLGPARLDAPSHAHRLTCMLTACYDDVEMARTIQVRDVPDDVHRTLRARAAAAGVSLSDYLRREMVRLAEPPARAA